MFYAKQTEACLWTVGFDHPRLGWQPESDHDDEREAKVRTHALNGIEARYVYTSFEPGLWTVGELGGQSFYPHSDHGSAREAAEETIRLNA